MHNITFVSNGSRRIAMALRIAANVGANQVQKVGRLWHHLALFSSISHHLAVTFSPFFVSEIDPRLIAVNRACSRIKKDFPRPARRMRQLPQLTHFPKT